MAYKRNVDLMDESLFQTDSLYGKISKPKESIGVCPINQTNDEIAEFVVKEMSHTLKPKEANL
jgi:hypothetical protein